MATSKPWYYLSAYALAVKHGFNGTEQEWLALLKGEQGIQGEQGEQGISAYEVAVKYGYTGTEQEWASDVNASRLAAAGSATNASGSADLAGAYATAAEEYANAANVMAANPTVVTSTEAMTGTEGLYVLLDGESEYNGYWFYYDATGEEWTPGGVYQASAAFNTDKNLTTEGAAADAKAVGTKITNLQGTSDTTIQNWSLRRAELMGGTAATSSTVSTVACSSTPVSGGLRIQMTGTPSANNVFSFCGANSSKPAWLTPGRYCLEITGEVSSATVYMQGKQTSNTTQHLMSSYYSKPGRYYWDVPSDTTAMRWVAYMKKNSAVAADFTISMYRVGDLSQIEQDLSTSATSLVQQNGKMIKAPGGSAGRYLPNTGESMAGTDANWYKTNRAPSSGSFIYVVCPGWLIRLYKWERKADTSSIAIANLTFIGSTSEQKNRCFIPLDSEYNTGWTYKRYVWAACITRANGDTTALSESEIDSIREALRVYEGYEPLDNYKQVDVRVVYPDGAQTLSVRTAIAEATTTVTVSEAITAAQASVLAGKQAIIGGTVYAIASATAGAEGEASITLGASISSASQGAVIQIVAVDAIPQRSSGSGTTLKIGTLNAASYSMTQTDDLINHPNEIIENRLFFAHADLDVLGLQEYRRNIGPTGSNVQFSPMEYLYRHVLPITSETVDSHRQAVFSKSLQLSDWTTVSAPTDEVGEGKPYSSARTFGYCTTAIGDDVLLLVSAHQYNSTVSHTSGQSDDGPVHARYSYLQQLFAKVAELKVSLGWKWCIIFGDFNTSNIDGKDSSNRLIYKDGEDYGTPDFANLLAACEQNDFTPVNGGTFGWYATTYYYPNHPLCQCLDNILVSDKVMIDDVSCDERNAKKLYTDHAPLLATVTLLD